ncbi:sodium/glutamate symporter [Candidatus Sororendozoicomonas aggregata]|uniref:sodium/glutamate symporter n=1 Tax=Candidatus Sororendozoicomonas aggregata TaxID=3073239 RepID=UPI002ED06823
MIVEVSTLTTLLLAMVVLFVGKLINRQVSFFRNYDIPEPVTGGLFVSIIIAILHMRGISFSFDSELSSALLLAFYSSIGLSARLSTLIQGGRALMVFLGLLIVLLLLQDFMGITIASMLGLDPVVGLIAGSISLTGGHGTAIAWAPQLQEAFGVENAVELGAVAATFGLVLGGFTGGPLAERLIRKYKLKSNSKEHITIGSRFNEEHELIDAQSTMFALFMIVLAMVLGSYISDYASSNGLFLPEFVGCLFAGILITNLLPLIVPRLQWSGATPSLAMISDVSLGLFLAMSLMAMKLWELAAMAGPLLVILAVQTVMILLFVYFIVFRVMGKDYDAAVMSSGFVGIGLGATSNAMANMTAVTQHYGASLKSFVVVPLAGAFFVDIANSVVLQLFMDMLN